MNTRLILLPLALFASLLLGSPSRAEAPPEHVMARYPAQWVAQPIMRQDKLTVQQILPPGQTSKDYTDAVILERYEEDHQAPKEHVMSRAEASRRSCDGVLSSTVDESPVNGYKAASIQFTCTKSHRNGKSGVMFVVAIAGRDALHVVSRVWLGPAVPANQLVPIPNTTLAEWAAFVRTITLCDSRDAQHPCPASPAQIPQGK